MIILSGGTGTPKLLRGLRHVVPEEDINVIANTAEDIWVSGHLVCPDIDSVIYALSGVIDDEKWWGIKGDTFITSTYLRRSGFAEKMQIGDRDRATHIMRSELLGSGKTLTQATLELTKKFGVRAKVLPMTDDAVSTIITTPQGKMHFQDFWILNKGKPGVLDVKFEGIEKARISKELLNVLKTEKTVIIGPSNPITSIEPILHLIRKYLDKKFVIAVSPIVGRRPVSGPAAKFMKARGYEVSSRGVYDCYKDFLDLFIVDRKDGFSGATVIKADTMMVDERRSGALARFIVDILKSHVA